MVNEQRANGYKRSCRLSIRKQAMSRFARRESGGSLELIKQRPDSRMGGFY